jgi:cytochrome c
MRRFLVLVLIVLLSAGTAFAETRGTTKEAKALVDKAIAFYKANGKAKAYAEFNDPKGKFVKKDLYVMVMDLDGNMLAHGANAKLIGNNLMALKDSHGKPVVREFIRIASTTGSGWLDYKWTNPISKKIEDKSSYVQKLDGNTFIVCGAYK